jgi:hypothetical protein
MIPSGLPELTSVQDLKYVRDALQPQTTDAEATIFFTRYGLFKCITEGRYPLALIYFTLVR